MTDRFEGFLEGTLRFLRGLAKNNSKPWFDAHRADYDAFYVDAAKSFVEAIGPGLQKISKTVHYEARVNGSLFPDQLDDRSGKALMKIAAQVRASALRHVGIVGSGLDRHASLRRECLAHFRRCAPVSRWVLEHTSG